MLLFLSPEFNTETNNTKYIPCDVSSWDSQAAMFATAYAWHGRLDFCALNAGITDRDDIFFSLSGDAARPPQKPDMSAFEVNLNGVYFGIKLGAHYMTLDSRAAGKPRTGGKFTLTSSMAGIFSLPGSPQYTASKYGVVGIVRSLGMMQDGPKDARICINAVCPGMVNTAILPAGIAESLPAETFTPVETVLRCHEELARLSEGAAADWVEVGPTGQTVQANLGELTWHEPPASETLQSEASVQAMTKFVIALRKEALGAVERGE